MTPSQALDLFSQVAALYKGTLQEHQQLQQAVLVLKQAIEVKPTPEVKEEENVQG